MKHLHVSDDATPIFPLSFCSDLQPVVSPFGHSRGQSAVVFGLLSFSPLCVSGEEYRHLVFPQTVALALHNV